jgi:hypothetical protein
MARGVTKGIGLEYSIGNRTEFNYSAGLGKLVLSPQSNAIDESFNYSRRRKIELRRRRRQSWRTNS